MKHHVILCLIIPVLHGLGQNLVPSLNDKKITAAYASRINAYAFQPQDVKLLDGPFKKAMNLDAAYLLEIEPDRLLHRFRKFAGLQPKGEIYGGWELESLSGHSLGHYLSACAMHYASTKNQEFLKRVNYIVDELKECQQARKTGYIGAIPKEDSVWNLVSQGKMHVLPFSLNEVWSPWYTEHKVLAGLLDAYWYADNKEALNIAKAFCDWVDEILKNLNDEQIQKMLDCEFGGMNEALVNTYALTGDKKYLDLSYKFEHNKIIDPLHDQVDDLNNKHSNTQVPKIIGSARRYEFTGSDKDKKVSEFFWETMVNKHTYSLGGNSDSEYLGKPGQLSDWLSDNTAETCNTYNMLKLTRHLFLQNPDSKYGDFYERALYNHILGSQRPTDGMMCYFTPLRRGAKRDYSDKFKSFWCCVGSGMENHVKYNESIYYKSLDGGVFVNLFIPSELNWSERNVSLTQTTNFPETPTTTIIIKSKRPESFKIYIRKPWWTKSDFYFSVNNTEIKPELLPNGYYVIERSWLNKDKLKIDMPMHLYMERMPDNGRRICFLYGPILLASPMGQEEPESLFGLPVSITDYEKITGIVKRGNDLIFTTNGIETPVDFRLVPLNSIYKERYNVYWDVYTANEWEKEKVRLEEEEKKLKETERLTVDFLQPGDSVSELKHNLKSEKSYHGESNQRKWRDAREEGFISFNMKVDPTLSNTFLLTFWGSDGGGRIIFDIIIDGETVATQEVRQNFPNRFFDVRFKLDDRFTHNKENITVTLKPQVDKRVARIFGARTIHE